MGRKKGELAGAPMFRGRSVFRKEMEVEDLKVKLPETLYALGSLGVCTAWRLLGKSTYFLSESI